MLLMPCLYAKAGVAGNPISSKEPRSVSALLGATSQMEIPSQLAWTSSEHRDMVIKEL